MAVAKQVRAHLVSLLSNQDWFSQELEKELPMKWEKHGDLVLLPEKTFTTFSVWSEHQDILKATCKLLHCNRLARRVGPTQSNDYRSPKVQMLFGNSSWVTKKENGILYSWDLSKCMFSSGNITEKQRIAGWDLRDQVVVDMYAGIGYFTLTYLVHAKARRVYACEWNPDAVEALHANLKLNKVPPERCVVLSGDNRQMCPSNVADHVNLGLIPSSEDGWPTACAALKKDTGGILHVHGNVDIKSPQQRTKYGDGSDNTCDYESSDNVVSNQFSIYSEWSSYVKQKLETIFSAIYPNERWEITVQEVIKIKSFAPHVDHVVADILCKPYHDKV